MARCRRCRLRDLRRREAGFADFLEGLRKCYPYSGAATEGAQAIFGRIYQVLEFGRQDPSYDGVRDLVGDFIFSFEKPHADGPVAAEAVGFLDSLRPHLARAALLASRLGLERARAMTEALQKVGLPAAVLKSRGKVHATNALFEALMPDLIDDQPSRLVFSDAAVHRLFLAGLDRIDRRASSAQGVGRHRSLRSLLDDMRLPAAAMAG